MSSLVQSIGGIHYQASVGVQWLLLGWCVVPQPADQMVILQTYDYK